MIDVINCTLSLVASNVDIRKLDIALMDYLASLYSSLSQITDLVNDTYILSKNTILSEYSKYIKNKFEEVDNTSIKQSSIDKISQVSKDLKLVGEDFDDETLADKMNALSRTLSSILNYDLKKSSNLRPIIDSRAEDLILSLKDRMRIYSFEVAAIKEHIKETEDILESCKLIKNIIDRNCIDTNKNSEFIRTMPTHELTKFLMDEYAKFLMEKCVKINKIDSGE